MSSRRRLTRMKPNRRYGFLQLGSRHEFSTKLLFAVDVSGSMGSEDLARGFSVINQFFRYGVPEIDVVQFDTELKGEVISLKRHRRQIEVVGRGERIFSRYSTILTFTEITTVQLSSRTGMPRSRGRPKIDVRGYSGCSSRNGLIVI